MFSTISLGMCCDTDITVPCVEVSTHQSMSVTASARSNNAYDLHGMRNQIDTLRHCTVETVVVPEFHRRIYEDFRKG